MGRRSYLARANRGKGAEVFFNNLIADSRKASRKRAKEKESQARREERERKRNEKERQAAENRAHKQRQIAEKNRLRIQKKLEQEEQKRKIQEEKEKQKKEKIYNEYYNFLKLDFRKRKLLFYDTIIQNIIEESLSAGHTKQQCVNYQVVGFEKEIVERTILQIISTNTDQEFSKDRRNSDIVSIILKKSFQSEEELLNDENYKKLFKRFDDQLAVDKFLETLKLLPSDYDSVINFSKDKNITVEKLKQTKIYKDSLLAYENKIELDEFMNKIKDEKSMLPEDYEQIIDLSAEFNYSVSKLKKSNEFINALNKKLELIKKLDARIQAFMKT